MPKLTHEQNERLDYLVDKIVVQEATLDEVVEAAELAKNYTRNISKAGLL